MKTKHENMKELFPFGLKWCTNILTEKSSDFDKIKLLGLQHCHFSIDYVWGYYCSNFLQIFLTSQKVGLEHSVIISEAQMT